MNLRPSEGNLVRHPEVRGPMTVEAVDRGAVRCVWFAGAALRRAAFPEGELAPMPVGYA